MKEKVICCPVCGCEYLPGEIFIPKYFLGQPKDIEKDFRGHILEFCGTKQDLTEEFVCDKCKSIFGVKASISYTVEEKVNFKNSYIQKL